MEPVIQPLTFNNSNIPSYFKTMDFKMMDFKQIPIQRVTEVWALNLAVCSRSWAIDMLLKLWTSLCLHFHMRHLSGRLDGSFWANLWHIPRIEYHFWPNSPASLWSLCVFSSHKSIASPWKLCSFPAPLHEFLHPWAPSRGHTSETFAKHTSGDDNGLAQCFAIETQGMQCNRL